MNILRKKLKFHRPDEMEKDILFRAQRNAYIFLIAALFLWPLPGDNTGSIAAPAHGQFADCLSVFPSYTFPPK